MDVQRLNEHLLEILHYFPEVSLVYLFGSQVEGRLGSMSDVDLGVLVDPRSDQERLRVRLNHELVKLLQTNQVDVVILNRVPVELAKSVIPHGSVLYQRQQVIRV